MHVRLRSSPVLIAVCGIFIVAAVVVAAWSVSTGAGESADDLLEIVSASHLEEHYDLVISKPAAGVQASLGRDAALATIRSVSPSRGDAPVNEAVLAQVRETSGPRPYDGLAWILSLAVVPPFSGGPMPVDGQCSPPLRSSHTVDDTFFLYVIDATSGEVVKAIGGTLEPVQLDELRCDVTPPAPVEGSG